MAVVEFKGLGSQDRNKPGTFPFALAKLIANGGKMKDVFEDIGKTGVTETTQFLMDNKVTPKTTDKTLEARRNPNKRKQFKKRRIAKGLTLVDTGIGLRQVAYKATQSSCEVGVPDGYMAYHQLGRVPNAPKRMFLRLPNRKYIMNLVRVHIERAMK